ncbi:MAG TPA: hydantoinase/oxoprolinase N-terminal domain-containing protein, partial [Ilumatobacteraceae bacterium]|nr:hydantoinase/oxoprolinase N-terminal domain-containing protein [Ilumatobacteraceae bacterium]
MYRIAVDVGGTFTDFIATSPAGEILEAKVPSNRTQPDVAFGAGLNELAHHAGLADAAALLAQTSMVIQGTTVAINAVLQTNGAKAGLLCTKGFRDTLEIRLGWKEERYLFNYTPPQVLVPRHLRVPVGERIGGDGTIHEPLNEADVHAAADVMLAEQVEAVAVCYLWSFVDPSHEQRTREILEQRLPGVYITTSHDILPRIREYNRTSTTVLDAYTGPIVHRHIARTEAILRDFGFTGRVRYVQS